MEWENTVLASFVRDGFPPYSPIPRLHRHPYGLKSPSTEKNF